MEKVIWILIAGCKNAKNAFNIYWHWLCLIGIGKQIPLWQKPYFVDYENGNFNRNLVLDLIKKMMALRPFLLGK